VNLSTTDRRSDELLLAAALAGEMEALAELVRRHQQPLANYLDRLVSPDWALAQDLVQETFLRVLRQQSSRGDRPFKPWLYLIATNLARDYFKSATARREIPLEAEQETIVAAETSGPDDEVLLREQHAALTGALQSVRAEYRAALLLRFYAELSLQDIATALDIPLGTVKSRLSVGLRKMRDALRAAETSADASTEAAVEAVSGAASGGAQQWMPRHTGR
jgi:RNA polymerase sigma-70 factor (ECF subfamily)